MRRRRLRLKKGLLGRLRTAIRKGGCVIQLPFLNLANKGAISREEAEKGSKSWKEPIPTGSMSFYRTGRARAIISASAVAITKPPTSASPQLPGCAGKPLSGNRFQTGGLTKLSRFITNDLLFRVNVYATIKKNEEGRSELDSFKYAVFANPYEKPCLQTDPISLIRSYREIPTLWAPGFLASTG